MVNERARRGLAIFEKGTDINQTGKTSFTVKSMSDEGCYTVEIKDYSWVCNCQDFINRGLHCKHIYAVKLYVVNLPALGSYSPSDMESVVMEKIRGFLNTVNLFSSPEKQQKQKEDALQLINDMLDDLGF